MTARVLVVEDEPAIREPLAAALRAGGYAVRELADGTDFESVVEAFRPDLAVLDLMLPGRDGYALTRALRSRGDTAVLMLTARDAVPDRVRGLRAGADDYVVKPFATEEVLARVGAILRRLGRVPATVQIGDLVLDEDAGAAVRAGHRLELAEQLDGSLSAQQLVDRLRGEGVTAQLCTRTTSQAAPVQSQGSQGSTAQTSGGPGSPGQGSSGDCVVAATAPAPLGAGPAAGAAAGPGAAAPAGPKAKKVKRAAVPVRAAGSVLFATAALSGNQLLTLSTDTTQISTAVNRLVLLEVAGGVAALLLAGLLLSRLSRVALRPLDEMTALAGQIAGGDRGRRLCAGRGDTELGRTAAAFDAMLDELENAALVAQRAETRMRVFLGDASHELRTPLAGVQAGAEHLVRDDPDRAERERIAVSMVRQTRRASRLVEDLLTIARLDADQDGLALRTEPVDLVTLVAAEVDRARLLSPELTITSTGNQPFTVLGDPVRLGQVLSNLLDNARHAIPPHGRIHVEVYGPADPHDSTGPAQVTVTDTGPGVPAGERHRIFERFSRVDASRSRHTGGAGLGLPIARGLARAHGGDLTYHDTGPGTGARFRLTLPAAPVAAPRPARPGRCPTPAPAPAPAPSSGMGGSGGTPGAGRSSPGAPEPRG